MIGLKKRVAIIGAGRIAYSLAFALIKNGYEVSTVVSRNIDSAKQLAQKFSVKRFSTDITVIPKATRLFFLAVPDGEIEKTTKSLTQLNHKFEKSLFIHLSGSADASVLNYLKKKGAITGSIHPMQTFPSKKVVSLKNVFAAVEANNEKTFQSLADICLELKMIPFRINSEHKTLYHLAGVFASNFLAGNLNTSKILLMQNEIPEEMFFDILNSTIYSTLDNIKKHGSANALSGPVERGDIKTIKKHISSLKKLNKSLNGNYFSSLLNNYLIQSLNLLILVEEKHGVLDKSHNRIRNLLVQELNKLNDCV